MSSVDEFVEEVSRLYRAHIKAVMKRAASECSDNDVFFDDGDMLKDGSVIDLHNT